MFENLKQFVTLSVIFLKLKENLINSKLAMHRYFIFHMTKFWKSRRKIICEIYILEKVEEKSYVKYTFSRFLAHNKFIQN